MYLNETMEKITEFLKSEAKTETIIGKEFKLGEYTCVPVMSLGLAVGGFGGKNKPDENSKSEREKAGAGAGAGFGVRPVGFLVSRGEHIHFIPASTSKGLNAVIERIPDLLDKFIHKGSEK